MSMRLMYCISLWVTALTVSTIRADITSDLVAWWALDDGSGTTAKDSGGHPGGPLRRATRRSRTPA